jgi:hypothetical protein
MDAKKFETVLVEIDNMLHEVIRELGVKWERQKWRTQVTWAL